ncbi:MAG: response regulator [Desulfovibrionaceae bacterium]|nr:response regulator [Desulfovibrionaceae bacterium]
MAFPSAADAAAAAPDADRSTAPAARAARPVRPDSRPEFHATPEEGELSATILYLNSYHDGYAWSDSILDGIRQVLTGPGLNIDLQIEYMDNKKYDYQSTKNILFKLYSDKFQYDYYDVVITSDNDAFNFMLEFGDTLFPGVPVVFCGVNDIDPNSIKGRNFTGVVENFDIGRTLDIALRLTPGFTKVIGIGDQSITSRAIQNQVAKVIPKYKGRLTFEFWNSYGLDEFLQRVRQNTDNVIYYLIPFHQNVMGKFLNTQKILEEVSRVSKVPLYSNWNFMLGHGIVGGALLAGEHHGRQAAQMALRLIRGERVADIPVITEPESVLRFDYNVLKRFNIPESALPEGSEIINRPKAFYELGKPIFWTIIVSLLFLALLSVFLINNIMRRRQVESQLKQQLSFQEILMDTVPLHVCWKDRKQRYLGANRAFTTFFGLASPEDILSRTDADFVTDADYATWSLRREREVLQSGAPLRSVRCNIKDRDGGTVCMEVNKVPLRDAYQNIMGTLTTGEDVTQRIDLERQLLQSQKMEAIGTLAGGIAHDFNNILTSIINSAELAQMDMDEEDMGQEDLSRVLKAARRGSRLVTQILTFSRPTREGFQAVDLAQIVREDMELIKASTPANIRISLDIPETPNLCTANPGHLHQVVMNLCTNSYQAMHETGGEIAVSLRDVDVPPEEAPAMGVAPGPYLQLTVADTGPGMPPEILHKIFDPFFTTKGKTEGTGLGLAVVHGIIKAHSGTVTVTSEPGQGARFEILLPRAAQSEVVIPAAGERALRGTERILFVEDDADQLVTVPRVLRSLGYRVTARPGGDEALAEFSAAPEAYDLIITDYDMPRMTGLDLARAVAAVDPSMRILLISGRRKAQEAATASPNIREVLLKPYNKVLLSEAVRATLAADPVGPAPMAQPGAQQGAEA